MGITAPYEQFAARNQGRRWWYFAASVALAAALWLNARDTGGAVDDFTFVLLAALLIAMVWAWGLFLICAWFAPAEPGRLTLGEGIRPALAVFLTLWLLFGTLWPLWAAIQRLR